MKTNACPDFSWCPAPRVASALRHIPLPEGRRLRRDHAHTPCALHHKVASVAYGDFDSFTREANASGI